MFNRDRRFFVAVNDLVKSGKAAEFSYEFYVEKRAVGGGLKKRLEITVLSALENSDLQRVLRSGQYSVFKVIHPTASP